MEPAKEPTLRPEDIPPEPIYPYPPHQPYAPPELLKQNEKPEKLEELEEPEEHEEPEEPKEHEEPEEPEETSKELEKKKFEENFERELSIEIENMEDERAKKKIEEQYEKISNLIKKKNIEHLDIHFDCEIIGEEIDFLRKKRNVLDAIEELRKKKKEMKKLRRERDACEPLEEEEEEDEAYEKERNKRDVFRYQKALEIRTIEKKIEKQKNLIRKMEDEANDLGNEINQRKADYIKFQQERKKEIEEEEQGKWPGEPRWGHLYY